MNFSIIIPHHNIPVLLDRLLDSIPCRQDTEIIVVDDNSDSSVVDFSNFPGTDRSDVKVIFDKQGGGGGHARNIGLKHATGKWILFADADDFFTQCFNSVLESYVDCDADIVFFKAISLDSELYHVTYRAEHLNAHVPIKSNKDELFLRYLFGEPWCKLIKRKCIVDNQICFSETSIHNDTRFSYMVGHYAKSVIADEHSIYCITTRVNSVSKLESEEKKIERVRVFSEAAMFYHNNLINLKPIMNQPYKQLALSYFENNQTFKKGINISKSEGLNIRELYGRIILEAGKVLLKKLLHRI